MSAVAVQNLGLSSEGPLSTEHFQELSRADDRAKLIRKAARVAAFNGWTTAIIAALSAPFALFSVAGFLPGHDHHLLRLDDVHGDQRVRHSHLGIYIESRTW
jgi:hypothetical protein